MKLAQRIFDSVIVTAAVVIVIAAWAWLALLPFGGIPPALIKLAPRQEPTTLAQLGTYGDMFGALTCLFTGLGFVGAGYAVVLQLRQLRHQQEDMERDKNDRLVAEKAKEIEEKKRAASEHTTAMLNAACFLAQTYATKLASFPPENITEDLSFSQIEKLGKMKAERDATALELEKRIAMLNIMFDRALSLAKAATPEEPGDNEGSR
jgi:hypothetical protein